jgi:hypothetical protein
MLGKRFCPRIRKLSKQRIYRIDEQRDYGALQPLVARTDRTIKMDWVVDQWDRMGQFYATLQSGHTTASVALKRLNSISLMGWGKLRIAKESYFRTVNLTETYKKLLENLLPMFSHLRLDRRCIAEQHQHESNRCYGSRSDHRRNLF